MLQKIGAALAAGCTAVVKAPLPNPLSCFLLAALSHDAGLPSGVVNVILADADVSAYLVGHRDVDVVSFTGSTRVGRQVAEVCGRLIRPCVLELGGKSAAIVLDDADLKTVVPKIVMAGVAANTGQACTAMSRVLVPRSTYAEAVSVFADVVGQLAIGDPREESTVIGPLISEQHRGSVEARVRDATAHGARIVTGGRRPPQMHNGWYFEPTVLADVENDMPVAREEIFGPVVCLIPYDGPTDAVRLANDSPYGLAASVWTRDSASAAAMARQLRAGTIGVNGFQPSYKLPFGGYADSGYGKENGPEGIAEFQRLKVIDGGDR